LFIPSFVPSSITSVYLPSNSKELQRKATEFGAGVGETFVQGPVGHVVDAGRITAAPPWMAVQKAAEQAR
jgi:hypothetical protein